MAESAPLTSGVLAAVLGAALLHALWNSLVKSAGDKFLASASVALWCGVAALLAGLALPRPAAAAAPFILASAYRGRDARCWAPPAQIRTGPI